jgi:MmyB-like transcription regulator ligand binding domain
MARLLFGARCSVHCVRWPSRTEMWCGAGSPIQRCGSTIRGAKHDYYRRLHVADLRAAVARHSGDRTVGALPARLRTESREFVELWERHEVAVRRRSGIRLVHRTGLKSCCSPRRRTTGSWCSPPRRAARQRSNCGWSAPASSSRWPTSNAEDTAEPCVAVRVLSSGRWPSRGPLRVFPWAWPGWWPSRCAWPHLDRGRLAGGGSTVCSGVRLVRCDWSSAIGWVG